ncbi:MAG TPA: GNAT family N-acetyltransferase [Chitinophagaceae bacterium]|nr:GNAT family N-acetyltransferase [Chitinophagaceae bacterium]
MSQREYFKFNGALLDNYLAAGYYRMGQFIFTTDTIVHDARRYFVFWLRYPLANFYFDKNPQKLISHNRNFKITIRNFNITEEVEKLYQAYAACVNFDVPPTLQLVLFGETFTDWTENAFDSEIIEIRDEDKLIAAGIYDRGLASLAGIMNFYDPAYKKYSLGKYLMLVKMQHAMDLRMQFYYPGYIAYEYTKFDYKLYPNPDLAEIYDSAKKTWLPYSKQQCRQLIDNFLKQMK